MPNDKPQGQKRAAKKEAGGGDVGDSGNAAGLNVIDTQLSGYHWPGELSSRTVIEPDLGGIVERRIDAAQGDGEIVRVNWEQDRHPAGATGHKNWIGGEGLILWRPGDWISEQQSEKKVGRPKIIHVHADRLHT